MAQKYKYLHFIDYILFQRWDVKAYAFQQKVFKNAVLLREILTPYNVPLSKEKMIDKGWSIIAKINFAGELFLRAPENTKTFKGNVHEIDGETLIYSKINVRHGCVYYHPKDSIPFGVSSEYPAYKIDNKRVNGDFLVLLLQSQYFKNALSAGTSGISKARVKPNVFLDIQIPLPSLEEQKNIVSTYNAKIEQANIYSLCTYRINKKIEDYLHNILETNIEFDISGSFLNYVNYKDISRWDALFLLSNNNIKSKYPLATLGQCISHFLTDQNGKSLRRETYKTPEKEYTYIGMENVKKETGEIIDNVIVKGKDLKSQTIYVPSNYFLYGKLRPYLNKYWYNNIEKQQEEIICSSEFFVFDIKNNINSKYFLYVLASYIVQKQIIDAMSGARMPRISEETFRGIQIPLPPLNIQNEIVEHIDVLRKEQKDLQQKALTLRQQATQQFEQTIFN